jgi:opacity protein-like surface antigen
MRIKRAAVLVAVAASLGLAVSGARAEVDGPVVGHFSFGPSFVEGDPSKALEDGWALHGGATWFATGRPNFGYRLDFGYDWWDAKNEFLDQIDTNPNTPLVVEPPDDGDARVWSGTFDLLWNSKGGGKVGFYLVGGAGVYYVQAHISETGYGYGYWCDPWWGWCYPGIVEGQYILQDQSSWEWGLNAGAGLTFQVTPHSEMYLEAVYHWMDTPSSASFVPVTLGFRW